MSDLLNPGDPEPSRPPRLSPQSRLRVALVTAAVVAVIAAGVSLGLAFATSSSASSATQGGGADPVLALPEGCELLTPGQLATLVSGTPVKAGRGPEVVLGVTESGCTWANAKTDSQDPRAQPAYLEAKATAAVDEETARETMRMSLPCRGARIAIPGAEEACLHHKPDPSAGGPADVSTVSARYRTLVVEVSYGRDAWPRWRVDDQAEVTAVALIGRIVQNNR